AVPLEIAIRIYFDDVDFFGRSHAQIDTRVVAHSERLERIDRDLLDLLRQLLRKIRRKNRPCSLELRPLLITFVAPLRFPARDLRALNSVKRQDLFRQRFVAGENETSGTRARISKIEKIEQRRDIRLQRASPPKRFSEVENELRLWIRQVLDERLH